MHITTHRNDAGHQACVQDTAFKSSYCNNTLEALESLLGVVEAAVWEKMKPKVSQSDWAVINKRSSEAPSGGWGSSAKNFEAQEERKTAEEREEEKQKKKQEAKEREREMLLEKLRDVIYEGVTEGVKAGLAGPSWAC